MYIEESLIGHIIMISAIFIIPWIAYKIVDSQKPKPKDVQISIVNGIPYLHNEKGEDTELINGIYTVVKDN